MTGTLNQEMKQETKSPKVPMSVKKKRILHGCPRQETEDKEGYGNHGSKMKEK